MQDERQLLLRVQSGDALAFEELISPFENKIYATCLRMMGSPEDARDCVQEAMIKIWRNADSFQWNASFSTWMYRVVSNVCLDALRKKKVRPSTSLDGMTETVGFEVVDPQMSPYDKLHKAEQKRAIVKALNDLPENMRAAFVLRDMQGRSYEEVAQALDTSLGTVKSRIHRARAKLADILSQSEELFEDVGVQ